jgi:hypothetical protein
MICLAEGRDQWWALLSTVMNLRVLKDTLICGVRFLHIETWMLLVTCNYSISVILFKHCFNTLILYSVECGMTIALNS